MLVHGNGPQVGLLALQNSAYDKVAPYPLDVLGAESRDDRLHAPAGAEKQPAPARGERPAHPVEWTPPTRPSATRPSTSARSTAKPGKTLQAEKGWVFKADGSYFRRVVPSPQPKRIVESDAIAALIQRDHR